MKRPGPPLSSPPWYLSGSCSPLTASVVHIQYRCRQLDHQTSGCQWLVPAKEAAATNKNPTLPASLTPPRGTRRRYLTPKRCFVCITHMMDLALSAHQHSFGWAGLPTRAKAPPTWRPPLPMQHLLLPKRHPGTVALRICVFSAGRYQQCLATNHLPASQGSTR